MTQTDVRPTHRSPRAGNRVLLASAAAAAVTAVGCFGAIQAGATPPGAGSAALAAHDGMAAPAQQASTTTSATQVQIKGYAFNPAALTVHVGDTVTWTNEDAAPHTVTVTSGPESFDSGQLQKGQSWSFTFTKAGSYQYYCAVHPDMTASVTVVAAEGGTGGGTGGGSTGGSTGGGSGTGGSTGGTGGGSTGGSTGGSGGGMGGTSGGSTGGGMGGTSGTGGGTPDGQCKDVNQVLMPILQHLYSAHLEQSPGQQAQDALNLDQYVKTHTVWVESILKPAVSGGQATVDPTLLTFLQHVNSAHLQESPLQQAADLLNPDQYVKTHTVWAAQLIKPTQDYLTKHC